MQVPRGDIGGKISSTETGAEPGEVLQVILAGAAGPESFGELPIGARHVSLGPADVLVLCVNDLGTLTAALPDLAERGGRSGRLWVAYAKLTSPLAGELNRSLIHDLVQHHGLDTVAQIALDQDWSTMRVTPLPPQ